MKNAQFAFDRPAFTTFGDMARFTIETKSAHEEEALLAFLNSGDYRYEIDASPPITLPDNLLDDLDKERKLHETGLSPSYSREEATDIIRGKRSF